MLETAEILRNEGLIVQDAIVFLDREQGGNINLENNNIKTKCVVTASMLLNILFNAGKIDQDTKYSIEKFIYSNSQGVVLPSKKI